MKVGGRRFSSTAHETAWKQSSSSGSRSLKVLSEEGAGESERW